MKGYAGDPFKCKCMVIGIDKDRLRVHTIGNARLPNGERDMWLEGAQDKDKSEGKDWVLGEFISKGTYRNGTRIEIIFYPRKQGSPGLKWYRADLTHPDASCRIVAGSLVPDCFAFQVKLSVLEFLGDDRIRMIEGPVAQKWLEKAGKKWDAGSPLNLVYVPGSMTEIDHIELDDDNGRDFDFMGWSSPNSDNEG